MPEKKKILEVKHLKQYFKNGRNVTKAVEENFMPEKKKILEVKHLKQYFKNGRNVTKAVDEKRKFWK